MKTTRTLMLSATLAGLTLTASAQSWLTNGLLAYYPFNGNANDMSGTGNNGIVQNATPAVDRFGRTNACYQFSSSWIFVPYNRSLYPTNQTISIWFKNTGVFHDTALMRAGNAFDDGWRGYGINTMNFNTTFGFWDGSGSSWAAETLAPVGQWPLNTWSHLVSTRGSNSAVLYLNGQVLAFGTGLPSYVPVQFSPLYIGSGEERWPPKTGPLVKMDFRSSAGEERADYESQTETA
ncbi:MAG: LamG domain-containing protein [Verrucomicrobia bacterium]|nr:LamG domain-containing protein [Verrucomicrobiota bacterium]